MATSFPGYLLGPSPPSEGRAAEGMCGTALGPGEALPRTLLAPQAGRASVSGVQEDAGPMSRMAPSPWSHAALPLSSRGLRESRAVAGALPPRRGPFPGMKGSPRPRDHCGASAGTRHRAQVHVLAQDGACLRQSTWPGSGGGGGRVQTGPSGGSPVPRPRRSSPSPASSVASLPVGVCPARGTRGTPELHARPS